MIDSQILCTPDNAFTAFIALMNLGEVVVVSIYRHTHNLSARIFSGLSDKPVANSPEFMPTEESLQFVEEPFQSLFHIVSF